MTHEPRIRLWLRALLFALLATVMAATLLAYANPDALVSFASLRLC
jgi:hypothetical protein